MPKPAAVVEPETPTRENYYDADRYTTSTLTIKLGGREYTLSGDPDCDLIAAILRADEAMREARGLDAATAVTDAKALFVELLREENEDVPDKIKIGVGRVTEIFMWLIGGDVQQEVGDAISGGLTAEEQAAELEAMQASGELDEDDELQEEESPLASSTTKRSSRSAPRTTGKRTTGARSRSESSRSTSEKRAAG